MSLTVDPRALAVALAEATDAVVWLLGADLASAGDSPTWRALTGQAPAEVAGRGWLDAVHPEDRAALLEALADAAREPRRCEVVHRVRRPGDRHTRARSRFVPLVGPDGALAGWAASTTEVWADEAVRRSEERLRLATQTARVAVWEYDFVAGQMTRTENHDGLYGYREPAPVWTYDLFIAATHPDDVALSDRMVQAACAPGGPDHYGFDFRVIWPDGSLHWLAVNGHVVGRDGEGRATLVRGALIDVTRLKDVEAELRQAVRIRDEFLQIASHELRTPLTPLSLKLETLERLVLAQRLDPPTLERHVAVAKRQVERLIALVGDLLDVTRLTHGVLALDRRATSLAEITRAVVEELGPEAHRQGCDVTLTVRDDAVGEWDRARLEQVVENLLGNALKYGRGAPVALDVSRAGGRARLAVRDQGIGIDPASLARVFERFERAPNARNLGGLGLGLFIVRQIVELHGGAVSASSQPGSGSTFVVELPLGDGHR